jgi:hypothetical protein
MKSTNLVGMAVIALGLSCKMKKQKKQTKQLTLMLFMLIRKCSSGDAKANWSSIITYE